jgi:hypothetical protein
MIGTLSSLASAFRPVVISVISCTRFWLAFRRRAGHQLHVVDHHDIEAALPLQPARAGRQLRDRDTARLVDEERHFLHHVGAGDQLLEIGLGNLAAADFRRGDFGLFGNDTGRQLFGRHFQRVEADHAAIDGLDRAVRLLLAAIRIGDVESDVGGKRCLAHARTARRG